LVGLFGTLGSYVRAGQALALASTLALLLGTGLLARAQAGRWAGALAALAAAFMPLVVEGSFWVSPYPLVAGAVALALGFGAACARWPRWGWALAAGACGGFALAMDTRALPVACALPLLAALGPGPGRRRLGLALLALGPLLAWEGADFALRAGYDLRLRSFRSQLAIQHDDQPGVGAPPPPEGFVAASRCEKQWGLKDPTPFGPCAGLRRAGNFGMLRSRLFLPPFGVLLCGLLFSLLPPAWGRRGSLASALVFWPTAASVAVGTSLVLYPSRYLLPVAPLLAALTPVALARLTGLPGLRWPAARRLAWFGAALAAAWLAFGWPSLRPAALLQPHQVFWRQKGTQGSDWSQDGHEALRQWALHDLGPDANLVDCAGLRLAMAVLPRVLPVVDAPPHHQTCLDWILHPEPATGTTWLLTLHQCDFGTDPRLLGPVQVARAGWVEVPLAAADGAALEAQGIKRWRSP
jgi:hypothetical protein